MRLRRDIWLVIGIPLAAISAVKTASDLGLDMDITKLSDNRVLVLPSEMQTPTPFKLVQDKQNEMRSLRRQLSKLTEENATLQASICACPQRSLYIHAAFEKPGLLGNRTRTDSSFSTNPDLLPLMMGFEKSSTKHPHVSPQHMGPNLPADSPQHRGPDMLAMVRTKKVIRRERMVYAIILGLAITYIATLVTVFFKTTADAKLRKQKERSSRNAALDYWKTRHKQERDLKALKEERYQLRIRHELRQLKKQEATDADADADTSKSEGPSNATM